MFWQKAYQMRRESERPAKFAGIVVTDAIVLGCEIKLEVFQSADGERRRTFGAFRRDFSADRRRFGAVFADWVDCASNSAQHLECSVTAFQMVNILSAQVALDG
jgi:hypothetical protein